MKSKWYCCNFKVKHTNEQMAEVKQVVIRVNSTRVKQLELLSSKNKQLEERIKQLEERNKQLEHWCECEEECCYHTSKELEEAEEKIEQLEKQNKQLETIVDALGGWDLREEEEEEEEEEFIDQPEEPN